MSWRLRVSCSPVASSSSKLAEAALSAVGGSRRVLADKLGVSKDHVGLVLAGERGFGPTALVRAARIIQRRALEVLREHGERELADELEAMIGEPITPEQRAHLERWDKIPDRLRQNLDGVLDAWFDVPAPVRTKKKRRTNR